MLSAQASSERHDAAYVIHSGSVRPVAVQNRKIATAKHTHHVEEQCSFCCNNIALIVKVGNAPGVQPDGGNTTISTEA